MSQIGVIAIGRNEGERLRRCLASVVGRGWPVVYVDSASSDGSPALAREMGAEVVELDPTIPFSAARARNEGFARLAVVAPDLSYAQAIDGDTEVVAGWIERAEQELNARNDVGVVCGRRRERFPEASVYNRLADIEWDTPVGDAPACGGDAMYRLAAFRQVGGFDNTVVAGEEPELCQRLRAAGWKVARVDAEMTLHDMAIMRLSQFWRRSVRNGYGVMDVARRFGQEGLYSRQVWSTRLWAVWLAAAMIAVSLAVGPLAALLSRGTTGVTATGLAAAAARSLAIGVGVLVLIYAAQIVRISLKVRPRVRDWGTAFAYGACIMVDKFGQYAGHRQLRRDQKAGKHRRLIEYKGPAMPAGDAANPRTSNTSRLQAFSGL